MASNLLTTVQVLSYYQNKLADYVNKTTDARRLVKLRYFQDGLDRLIKLTSASVPLSRSGIKAELRFGFNGMKNFSIKIKSFRKVFLFAMFTKNVTIKSMRVSDTGLVFGVQF